MAPEPLTFGSSVPGYVCGPLGAPAVVLLSEWWGVNENVRSHATKLAALGPFRVLVPDLYKGKIGHDKEEAAHLMSNLDWGVALSEVGQAVAHLQSEAPVKVGVTGFCMGGAMSLLAAATIPAVAAACPFYGTPQPDRCDLSRLVKPVLAHFGELDGHSGFSDPATAARLASDLKAGGNPDSEVVLVPAQGHGFMNASPDPYKTFEERQAAMGMPPYDPAPVEAAWGRVTAFFRKHLA